MNPFKTDSSQARRETHHVSRLLQVLAGQTSNLCKAIGNDLLRSLGYWHLARLQTSSKVQSIIKYWQGFYVKKQKQLTDVIARYKQHHFDRVENLNAYCSLVVLVDSDLNPVHEDDVSPAPAPEPEFESTIPHQHEFFQTGKISDTALNPEIKSLQGESAKLLARILGIIYRIALINMRSLTDLLEFKTFPEVLPEVTNFRQRPFPKARNILDNLTGGYGLLITLIYLASLASEGLIFVNIGINTLRLDLIEALIYAAALVGVSYLLALRLFYPMQKFLRTVRYSPGVFWLFIGCTILYMHAASHLNYVALQKTKLQQQYFIEIGELESLQLANFTNPNDILISQELEIQNALVEELQEQLAEDTPFNQGVAHALFIIMSLLALITSTLLLACKLVISKARSLYRNQKKAQSGIIKCQSDYEHALSDLRKTRDLMGVFAFQLGAYQAVKGLQAIPPTASELLSDVQSDSTFGHNKQETEAPTGQKPTSPSDDTPEAQDILSSNDYSKLYNDEN